MNKWRLEHDIGGWYLGSSNVSAYTLRLCTRQIVAEIVPAKYRHRVIYGIGCDHTGQLWCSWRYVSIGKKNHWPGLRYIGLV